MQTVIAYRWRYDGFIQTLYTNFNVLDLHGMQERMSRSLPTSHTALTFYHQNQITKIRDGQKTTTSNQS